jgi:hypothetical protein
MSKQSERGSHFRTPEATEPEHKSVALVQLVATATLALSLLIAATAVTIGLARAEVAATMTGASAVPSVMTITPKDGAA